MTIQSILDPVILFLMALVIIITVGVLAVEIRYLD